MSDLPIRIEVMPPCLCESKVIGYEYIEAGFNVTHCACGGVMSCKEIEDVEVKKPFDITEHEFSDSDLSVVKSDGGTMWVDIENGSLDERCNASAMIIKQDAIAIAKALGVTGEDLK